MKKAKMRRAALHISITLSMLAAASIICGKYLAINAGEFMRFSLENLPVLFAGLTLGPLAGAAVGAVADLVGCLMVGYAINPIITLGAAAVGFLGGGAYMLLQRLRLPHPIVLSVSLLLAHGIGSVLIKGAGLSAFYEIPFGILILWRLLNYAIVGAIEGVLLFLLLRSSAIKKTVEKIKRG